jgi:hypothetical protein
MKDTIIVTDLTRFRKNGKVCLAGYSQQQRRIIRPLLSEYLPDAYLDQEQCERYNILPGTRLMGDFETMNHPSPHNEDYLARGEINVCTPVTKDVFLKVLQETSCRSLCEGFGCDINSKVIPIHIKPICSIITISVCPNSIKLVPDYYGCDIRTLKVKLNVSGLPNDTILSLTDLGFYRYAMSFVNTCSIDNLNSFLQKQTVIYLRIGLSRAFSPQDGSERNGYWMQVNGIYSFPDYHKQIRSY